MDAETASVTMRCPVCDHPVTIRDDASPLPVACAKCGRHYSTEFYLMLSAHVSIWNRSTLTGAPA